MYVCGSSRGIRMNRRTGIDWGDVGGHRQVQEVG